MRIGILGGPEFAAEPPLARAVRGLGAEIGRRCWTMVLGVPGPVAADAVVRGLDIVEVLPRGAEPLTCATDRRVVSGPRTRMDAVRLLSDAVVVLPGGVEVLADLLRLLTEEALGLAGKPCGVLDPTGLLDPLAEQLDVLDHSGLPAAPLLRAADPAELLDGLAAWRPSEVELREEVAWLRVNGAGLALLPGPAGLGLPGGVCGSEEPGPVALCRLLGEGASVSLRPEQLRPAGILVVPGPDGAWRRVSCYRSDGPQPPVPGAVAHPIGDASSCDPAAAALQDLLRRGQLC